MIQILGIRRFFSKKAGKELAYDAFFKEKWRAPSVAHLFANIETYLEKIPEKEQWNLYYTCANCLEEKGRKLREQSVLPFDVDGIDVERRKEYLKPVLQALGVKHDDTGIIFSGNGLQFIIGLSSPFTSTTFFEENRVHYRAVCEKINQALKKSQLPGEADPTGFSAARLMRLPLTRNIKLNKPERLGELYNRTIVPVSFELKVLSGLPDIKATDHINPEQYKKFPKPDTKAVISECEFLKHCREHQGDIRESAWYAMLSVVGRLENGSQLAHSFSDSHPGYSHYECESKLTQALESSGPRTCVNINAEWGGCKSCKHFEKINSPILIRGPDFIKTELNGFHDITFNKNNEVKTGRPNYEDLRKYFKKKKDYLILGESKVCLVWNEKYWEILPDVYLENFAQSHFIPVATTKMTKEFLNLVCRTRLRDPAWFTDTTLKKVNFQNGILDLESGEFGSHSKEIGFRYVLPYDYDPKAQAPRFERYMDEIMMGDKGLMSVLLEFAGYAFSNDECWTDKSLFMSGDGSNGKSVFMDVIRRLAGEGNYASLGISELRGEVNRSILDGKLFSMAEETPGNTLKDTSLFKNIVAGGELTCRQLYKMPYSFRNKCKFIFACNDLPQSSDVSKGFLRRLLIVPFDKLFEGKNIDPFLRSKLYKELPGIFNIVISHYKNLQARQEFLNPDKIKKATDEYKLSIDTVAQWFQDHVTVEKFNLEKGHDKNPLRVRTMYSNYKTETEIDGAKPETKSVFSRRLKRLLPEYESRHVRRYIEGVRETCFSAVRMNQEQAEF